jgi:hypothetical protein
LRWNERQRQKSFTNNAFTPQSDGSTTASSTDDEETSRPPSAQALDAYTISFQESIDNDQLAKENTGIQLTEEERVKAALKSNPFPEKPAIDVEDEVGNTNAGPTWNFQDFIGKL